MSGDFQVKQFGRNHYRVLIGTTFALVGGPVVVAGVGWADPVQPCDAMAVSWNTFYAHTNGTRVVLKKPTLVSPRPQFALPDSYLIVIQTTDGSHFMENAYITQDATGLWDGFTEHDFLFRTVDPSDVKKVLLTNSKGTCSVQGAP